MAQVLVREVKRYLSTQPRKVKQRPPVACSFFNIQVTLQLWGAGRAGRSQQRCPTWNQNGTGHRDGGSETWRGRGGTSQRTDHLPQSKPNLQANHRVCKVARERGTGNGKSLRSPMVIHTGRTRCHKSFLSPATSLLILVPFSSSEAFHGLAFELSISRGPSTHTPALTLCPCRPLPTFPL